MAPVTAAVAIVVVVVVVMAEVVCVEGAQVVCRGVLHEAKGHFLRDLAVDRQPHVASPLELMRSLLGSASNVSTAGAAATGGRPLGRGWVHGQKPPVPPLLGWFPRQAVRQHSN